MHSLVGLHAPPPSSHDYIGLIGLQVYGTLASSAALYAASPQLNNYHSAIRGRPYMTSTAGGGGSAPCGRLWTGGGGVEQVYDVRMVCFLEHNATVPH